MKLCYCNDNCVVDYDNCVVKYEHNLLETLTFADSIYTERYMGQPTDEGNTYEVSGTYTVSS